MFNPLEPFTPRYLPAFKQKGVQAFVKQTYDRGRNKLEAEPAPAFILIHFNEKKRAREHYEVIKTDPNRKMFDLENDYDELQAMLQSGNERFYMALTSDAAIARAPKVLDRQIRWYIDCKTNWQPRGYQYVHFSLELQFGELYAKLRYKSMEVKMRLDELDR